MGKRETMEMVDSADIENLDSDIDVDEFVAQK